MRNRHLLPCCLPRGRLGLFSNRRYPGEIAFPDLTMIGMIESETECDGKIERQRRYYYLFSAKLDLKTFARAVRGHWGIENRLHWILDVVFCDDLARLRSGHGSENRAAVKHMALSLLRQAKSATSLKNRRKRAGWELDDLDRRSHGPA
jgi:predicted transposase YbfD/YdcC